MVCDWLDCFMPHGQILAKCYLQLFALWFGCWHPFHTVSTVFNRDSWLNACLLCKSVAMYCICVVANALSKTCFLCLNVCDYFVFVFVWYFVCFDWIVYWWFVIVSFGKMFSLENVFWGAFKIMSGPLFVLLHVSWVLSHNRKSCVVFIWAVMCK